MLSSSPNIIRILLLDSDVIARAGMKLLLETRPNYEVTGQAGEAEEALTLARQDPPDIVVIHESTENILGPDFACDLLAATRKPRIILVTAITDRDYHIRVIKNGIVGIIQTHCQPEILLKAVEKVHAGEVWLDRSLMASFILSNQQEDASPNGDSQTAKIGLLSERERDIITLVGEGLKNQQIADQLFLSEVTVRHHLTSIYKKLSVTDRLELVIYAYKHGLAHIPQ